MTEQVSAESVGLSSSRLDAIGPYLDGYVDAGKLPGYQAFVMRRKKLVWQRCYGHRDVDSKLPVEPDTIFRLYSMTKPITCAAMLMLYEQGHFQLNDPVSQWIPAFKDMLVFDGGTVDNHKTRAADRPITIRDLFTHTSGLAYGLFDTHPVEALYRQHKVLNGSLDNLIEKITDLPLVFSPGTQWNYSVATDVLGYLVQKIADQPLDDFFRRRIFEPLNMPDTAFWTKQSDRLATCYHFKANESGEPSILRSPSQFNDAFNARPPMLSGGGGLVGTAQDYLQFVRMLLNQGHLHGERLLGRKTVELMTANHLPGGTDLSGMGMPVFSETPYDGIGFGLGVSVLLDPAASQILGSPGEYAWGGMASTAFWIDPAEQMAVIFLTQLIPSSSYPIRRGLRVLANQAIID